MNTTFSIQEAREQDYATSGVFRKKTDAENLHTFFSSYMVPADLLDDEVRICLELHERREKLSKRLSDKKKVEIRDKLQKGFEDDYLALEKERETLGFIFGEHAFGMTVEEIANLHSDIYLTMYWPPIPLPRELTQSPMTRQSFASGVRTLIERMDAFDQEQR